MHNQIERKICSADTPIPIRRDAIMHRTSNKIFEYD